MTIDICGDISLSYVNDSREIGDSINEINKVIEQSDWSIANFEMAYQHEGKCIIKDGPNLGTTKDTEFIINKLNFNAYTLANNHVGDFGEEGIKKTIEALERLGIHTVGAGSIDERYLPLRITDKGNNISVFSFCENEFGAFDRFGVAVYNPELIIRLIMEERKQGRMVFVIFHGGAEFYPFPTPDMKKRYCALIDAGADLVVGMHQHCICGFETYKGKRIYYGIGNLLFPRVFHPAFPGWEYGFIVRVKVEGNSLSFYTIPYFSDYRGKIFKLINNVGFEEYVELVSRPIMNKDHLASLFDAWCSMSGEQRSRKLVAGMINSSNPKITAFVKNAFSCETHRELFIRFFEMLYKDNMPDPKMCDEVKRFMNIPQMFDSSKYGRREIKDLKYVFWGIGLKAQQCYEKLGQSHREKVAFVDGDPIKQGLGYIGNSFILSPEQVLEFDTIEKYYLCMNRGISEAEQYLIAHGINKDIIEKVN